MKTHEYRDFYPLCGTTEAYNEPIATNGAEPTCLECRFFDRVQGAWEEYISIPLNFGPNSRLAEMAEHDAFFAGAFAMLKLTVPF